MLISKNVNSDVSKDSPIVKAFQNRGKVSSKTLSSETLEVHIPEASTSLI